MAMFRSRKQGGVHFRRDPSTLSEGDWRRCYAGLEGPSIPSVKVRLDP